MRDPRWDRIFTPDGKGGIPLPKVGSPTWDPMWDWQDLTEILSDILPGAPQKIFGMKTALVEMSHGAVTTEIWPLDRQHIVPYKIPYLRQ